jgi:hypothetical protein
VQKFWTIDTHAHSELLVRQKSTPVTVNERRVSLDCLTYAELPLIVNFYQFARSPVEVDADSERLSGVPKKFN